MKNEENLQDILKQVQNVDNGINSMLVPILKDTIKDCNMHNKRMFILNIVLSFILGIVILVSLYLVYRQNIKYQEFLNQFEFETEIYQDTDDNSIINSGINVTK